MTPLRAAALLGCVGLTASSAQAQINWTTQMQFRHRAGGVDSAPLAGNAITVTATGTYTFTVQVGIFNVTGLSTGQANCGLNNWTANLWATGLAADESLALTVTNSRVSPFQFGPATSFGGRLLNPSTIVDVNAARDVSGGATAPWLWDNDLHGPAPMPTLPTNPLPGSESFINVWRFRVVVGTLIGPDIVVNFAGQAGPVLQWVYFGSSPPDVDTPAFVSFLGLTPTPVLRDYAPATLTLHRIPAPGAAGGLLLAIAVRSHRRRH